MGSCSALRSVAFRCRVDRKKDAENCDFGIFEESKNQAAPFSPNSKIAAFSKAAGMSKKEDRRQ